MNNSGFEKGQYIIYGTNGLCVVENIKHMSFIRGEEKKPYYILEPVKARASTIFVPIDNENLVSKMRNIMTRTEIDSLLMGMSGKEFEWEDDRRIRSEAFHDIIAKGVSEDLLLMIRCIYLKKRELEERNKKLAMTDSKALEFAVSMVEEEFSYVLDINRSEVGVYIRNILGM